MDTVKRDGGVIDADLQCAPPEMQDLLPLLTPHWRDYLTQNGFTKPSGIRYSYPSARHLTRPAGAAHAGRAALPEDVSAAILRCFYGLESLQHPYLATALMRAANDWLLDRWLGADDRLRGSILVTPQFTEAAVEEIERIGSDPRMVEVLLPVRSSEPYGHPRYRPLWRAAAAQGLVVALNYGGGASSPPTPVGWMSSFLEEYVACTVAFQTQVFSIVASGILDEFPDLKVTVVQSGWSWLPAFLWRADTDWKAFRREIPWVREAPSAYVRRHFRFTSAPYDLPADRHHARQVIDQLGSEELLLFGSGVEDDDRTRSDLLASHLSSAEQEKFFTANAAEWYGLT